MPNLFLMKGLRHIKLIIACAIMGLLPMAVVFAAEKASPDGSVEWSVSDDKGSEFRLEVREVSLQRVFSRITDETGVPVHYSVVPGGLVTATCLGSTLKQVMECLLDKRADLIVRYPKFSASVQGGNKAKVGDKNQPAEMWVLGSKFTSPANCSGSDLTQHAIDNTPAKLPEHQADSADAEPDQTDDLLNMAKANDPTTRADAIGALMAGGRAGDPNVKAALEQALTDANANVRAQAISSLSHREGDAASAALQEALHDSDAGVRLMAVDGAGSNLALLQQAVNDDDETVRKLAVSKLESLQETVK